MKTTANQKNTQQCLVMSVCLRALYDTLVESGDVISVERRLSISKLAIWLRDEIDAADAESFICKAREDARFQSFKARLIKKPRKGSRLAKSLALH